MKRSSYSIVLQDHSVDVNDSDAEGEGEGEPVVLVHSAILDQAVWTSLVDLVPGQRLISYDIRGHGSAAGAPPIRHFTQLSSDLAALLDQIGLGRCHLVGVSLGGAVIQQFAAEHPNRVRSLVVVASATKFPAVTLRLRAQSLATEGRGAIVDETLERWFTSSALRQDAKCVQYARDRLAAVTEQTWRSTWNALADFRLESARGLQAPVLAIAGGADRSTPPAVVRQVAAAYPVGFYAEIEGAPHMVMLERPAALATLLDEFLQVVEAQRSPSGVR
jgi:3-oxoadipate enol-lactonase